ncbi:hypothetical protein EIP86_003071 [Pleurotus ostreatoroseus]|nr:hypothetical protein EIP86_003071 [Pleurotus ostreatoroseus]
MDAIGQVSSVDAGHHAPSLPSEIVVSILDYFRRDKITLFSCSLVAKSWVLLTRFHLFRVVTVRCGADLQGLGAFLDFLHTPWGSNISAYVRELRIRGPYAYALKPVRDPVIELETLGAVLDKLTRLDTLELEALAWPGIDPDTTAMPLTSASVKTIILSRICIPLFPTFDDIFDILHLVPHAKTFRGHGVEWRKPLLSSEPRKRFPADLQLESIILKATALPQQLVDLSQSRLNLQSLTSLSVWHIRAEDVEVLGRFLLSVSAHLRQLHMKLGDTYFVDEPGPLSPETTWPLLNLSECTALESFWIFVPMDDDPELPGPAIDFVPHWESVEVIIDTLPAGVRNIRFGLEVLDKSFVKELLRDVQWDVVEGLVARLQELRSVLFLLEDRLEEFFVDQLPSSIQKLIKNRLPATGRRQLLRFVPPPRV